MAIKPLGFKQEKKPLKGKLVHFEPFEEEFMAFWKSLGFSTPKDKTAKYYKKSVRYLRYLLRGEKFFWLDRPLSIKEIQHFCIIFKEHAELNKFFESEGRKYDLKKFYFHQFVLSFSGHSFLRDILEGKLASVEVDDDLAAFANEISILIRKNLKREAGFSSGEYARILSFAKTIQSFFNNNRGKIAFGVDALSLVKASYKVINEFRKIKGITSNVLIYTGNYAAGAALEQAMDQFSYWKIYEKHEDDKAIVTKDPDKVRRVIEEQKKKEEENLPDIVKRRREEMRKNGTVCKPKDTDEDCSRRDEYLRKKKEKRNPFGR
jgi:hypothetical protein